MGSVWIWLVGCVIWFSGLFLILFGVVLGVLGCLLWVGVIVI